MIRIQLKKLFVNNLAALLVLVLCLTGTVAGAQTPAQDEATIAMDQQALDESQEVVKDDILLLSGAQQYNNADAVKADAAHLLADQQAERAANDKLNADEKELRSDNREF